jgi:hypothetical protein
MIRPTRLRKGDGQHDRRRAAGFSALPIEWRDLAATTPADAIRELLLPAPWLFGSLILAAQELYPLALTASFVFFLTGLRVVHGAFNTRWACHAARRTLSCSPSAWRCSARCMPCSGTPEVSNSRLAKYLNKMSVPSVLRLPACATRVSNNAVQACQADEAIRLRGSTVCPTHSR